MSESKKIPIAVYSIVIIVICLGLNSHWQLNRISQDTDDLYQHPFAVSNAAKNINFHLVAMHRYMKDVVLANNEQELVLAVKSVRQHEQQVLKQFDIIFERFLGDKSQINKTYRSFIDWHAIRSEVIQLKRDNQDAAAIAITKGKGAIHVGKLNLLVEELIAFAFNKAEEFHGRALSNRNNAILVNIAFTITALILVVVYSKRIRKNLTQVQKDRCYRNHLIDQNIMMATLDKDGRTLEASSALCRFLSVQKNDLIGKHSHFFDNSDNYQQLEDEVLSQIQTGKEWQGEISHCNHQGKISWAQSKVLPQYDEDYHIIGFTNILVSITNKKLSGVDQLTSLLNRRRYDEIITHEIRVAKRNEQPFTLAVLDIDYFKKYNDHFGHPKGDLVLQKVAKQITTFINRPNDYAFRIGGEEFAIMFSGLDSEQALQRLHKIRTSIEALNIAHPESEVANVVTVSLGGYVLNPNTNINEERIYIEADKALYQAKERRNTVVIMRSSLYQAASSPSTVSLLANS